VGIKITEMPCIEITEIPCIKNCCVSITCVFVLFFSVYATISLGTLHAVVTETQLTLHTALTMAQERHKIHPSVCYVNNTAGYNDMCSMIDVASDILDRFPDNKVAYKLVNFMSFLYGFTIIV
jgi:hypothetical protein